MGEKNTSWGPNHNFDSAYQFNPFKHHPRFEGGLVISVLAAFALLVVFFVWNLAPVEPGARTTQSFEVPYGVSLRQVCQKLERQGIIRNKVVFEIFMRLNQEKRVTKAGHFRLGPGMSVPKIVNELVSGRPRNIRITIPEGLTNKEIATLLAQKGLVNQERFLKLTADSDFVNQVLESIRVKGGAEGYLFPDTYEFELNITEKEIIAAMLKQFEKVYFQHFASIPEKRRREVVIIASLVEKEAKEPEERPVIAGVFYNRLKRNLALQSCATVQYVLGKHKERLLYQDLQIDSPYNTYRHPGLPPGPIANPGLDSLKAAAKPRDVPFLFFVAGVDGKHVFSNTYAEHIKAQQRISRERKNRAAGISSKTQ
ncbi:MAG: endolytic transglycosylase MltG [Bacillota bacterium]|jgi:UPF0755 protein